MSLPPLPAQPSDVPWPTEEWPRGDYPTAAVRGRVGELLDQAFRAPSTPEMGETHATVIVHRGRLIEERYADGVDAAQTQPSWSKAKSITHALVGMLVGDGRLDIAAPAPVPEWAAPGDPRNAITLDHLLRMSSGLKFTENYEPGSPSDVIAMLFGEGQADVGAFAASFPAIHAPGAHFAYSSGTTNIVSRCAAEAAGAHGPDFEAFMRRRLFEPLGMRSPIPKFDAAGTFIGSSFCFCTPQDFARFGLLYLRGGAWDGQRLLPEGWIDYARTPTWRQPDAVDGPYGAHWWLDMAGPGSFSANGYEGQFTVLVPDLDLIVVRNGKTPLELKAAVPAWIAAIAQAFRAG
jgi:CubicO group peptidase (beta-lactamase class C family)